MKKIIALLVLVLTMASASLAQADVNITAGYTAPCAPPYHRVAYRHWVRGRGWVVDYRYHRLVWNRYHHCYM